MKKEVVKGIGSRGVGGYRGKRRQPLSTMRATQSDHAPRVTQGSPFVMGVSVAVALLARLPALMGKKLEKHGLYDAIEALQQGFNANLGKSLR